MDVALHQAIFSLQCFFLHDFKWSHLISGAGFPGKKNVRVLMNVPKSDISNKWLHNVLATESLPNFQSLCSHRQAHLRHHLLMAHSGNGHGTATASQAIHHSALWITYINYLEHHRLPC